MPDANVAKTLIRVFDLLRLLPRHGAGKTAGAMHEELLLRGYEIEKRTVERDLRMLQSAFPEYLGCDDRTKPFGWHWQPGRELCVTDIQPAEAIVLEIVAGTLLTSLPATVQEPLAPRFTQARLALREHSGKMADPAGHSRLVVHLAPPFPAQRPTQLPEIAPEILHGIATALLAHEQVEVALENPENAGSLRVKLTPVALLQRGAVTRLVAFRAGSQTPEHFAIHHLRELVCLHQQGEPLPPSFVLEEFIATLAGDDSGENASLHDIRLHARISDSLRQELLDTPLSTDQQVVHRDGAWHLQASVPSGPGLLTWILQRGAEIRIDQPAELRALAIAELDRARAAYTPAPV